ncbi:MAG: DNA protecting protein DprA [Candidatus Liptonbacteria bacterium RIFCSPLOWO2_01_FULL_45_15]|uniref:DNA protecting protein DprA n=1 Tax=Candidatus Liptonbacteria bacterium RIFCSPLOWO2_01_FULL_45_15 TaxID=1798649 RepID=A0A1G2CGG9_9BACT|nr:MAG: DNA protecting protein DprA [Candidatus Liptonbacteria bacterium RIFCSPLOWO2_01_FULL_45_15]
MALEMDKEKFFYNAAWGAAGCNHREISKLKSDFGTWEEIFEKLSGKGVKAEPEKEWMKLEKCGIRMIFSEESVFPEFLREIYWPPLAVYVKGETAFLKNPAVAIVGTRKATEDGIEIARQFGRELAEAGITVVSGLAFGIDAAAHRGCLDVGGKTVAVLPRGLDEVYPKSNERLAEEIIAAGGAVISEYPPGIPPLPHRFIERNRIVSGLSLGTVVIEVPERSGALATARFASEQNREVFVVPGPAGHRNFSGSHKLIRSGARLVSKPSDVLEDLNIIEPSEERDDGKTEEEKIVLKILSGSAEPLGIDKITEMAELESRVANQALTLLLLKNEIKEEGEGYTLCK